LDGEIGSLGADTGYSTAHFKKHGKPIIESLFQPVCCGANKKNEKMDQRAGNLLILYNYIKESVSINSLNMLAIQLSYPVITTSPLKNVNN
jgi:hypothetical protein